MCGPYAAAALALGGAAVGAYGQIYQGMAVKAQSRYEADVMDNNAQIADYQAADAAKRGNDTENKIQDESVKRIGQGRVGFAAGNVMLDSGSAGRWQSEMEAQMGSDVAANKYNTAMNIWALNNQAQDLRAGARAKRAAGSAAMSGATIGAVGTLLGGAASTGYGMGSSGGGS